VRSVVVFLLVVITSSGTVAAAAQAPAADCVRWDECRDRALEARASGQYERFHDLAWRAVQTGSPDDPALMYLLARAQALSGRRRDALIMLRRLADMGVPTDAATEEDFRRTRELAGWTAIESRFARLATEGLPSPPAASATPPAATPPAVTTPAVAAAPTPRAATPVAPPAMPAPAVATAPPGLPGGASPASPVAPAVRAGPPPAATPVVPTPAAATATVAAPLPTTEVARFATDAFGPAGIAYDEVSRRFLFGDMRGRRLFVVGEGSSRTVDLIRGDAAGFHDVTAIEIDGRRGDLWVTSTAADGSAAALHRLQLTSGRALATVPAPADATIALSDLTVSPGGAVLLLDSGARRVLRLAPAAKSIEAVLSLDLADPASLAAANTDRIAYVAHAGGIARLDFQQRTTRELTAAAGVPLSGFDRIRWHRNSLVGVQRLPDGQRGLAVVQLDRAGTRATSRRVIDPSLDGDAGSTMLTVVGDDVYYSVIDAADPATATTVDVLIRRIQLP
jgi:sugar lactone lactonase YvrE